MRVVVDFKYEIGQKVEYKDSYIVGIFDEIETIKARTIKDLEIINFSGKFKPVYKMADGSRICEDKIIRVVKENK